MSARSIIRRDYQIINKALFSANVRSQYTTDLEKWLGASKSVARLIANCSTRSVANLVNGYHAPLVIVNCLALRRAEILTSTLPEGAKANMPEWIQELNQSVLHLVHRMVMAGTSIYGSGEALAQLLFGLDGHAIATFSNASTHEVDDWCNKDISVVQLINSNSTEQWDRYLIAERMTNPRSADFVHEAMLLNLATACLSNSHSTVRVAK